MSLYIVYENYVFCPFSRFVRGCGKLLYRACLRVMELPLNYLMFVLINVFNVVNFLALDELLIFVILLIFWMENKVFAQKKKKSWGRRSKIYQGRGLDGERAVCDLMHEFCIRCWWCHYILRQRWVSIQSVDGYENSDADGWILWRSGFWKENSEVLVFWLPKY